MILRSYIVVDAVADLTYVGRHVPYLYCLGGVPCHLPTHDSLTTSSDTLVSIMAYLSL